MIKKIDTKNKNHIKNKNLYFKTEQIINVFNMLKLRNLELRRTNMLKKILLGN